MEQFLLALCGLPASGKTTLVQALQKALDIAVQIVSSDDWRDTDYYTDWKPEKERVVRQATLAKVRELIDRGEYVIHDDTNYYKSMRHELYKIAQERVCLFAIVHITTPLEKAIEWNNTRKSSKITEEIIRRIDERFDKPGGRYLWDFPVAEIDLATQDLDSAVSNILDILNTLEIVEEPRYVRVTERIGEVLDQITRECVTIFLNEHPEMRGNREVSKIRRSVLKKAIEENTDVDIVRETILKQLSSLIIS